ncbi:MAG: PAS domain S-box protein [Deltaproteobacteria bacterium]|nr:PAS domain S-box protein [Deltaproteobacteria bacterium]
MYLAGRSRRIGGTSSRGGVTTLRRLGGLVPSDSTAEPLSRLLLESAPVGLALCRMDGAHVLVNPMYAKTIGRSGEDILRLKLRDITPERWAAQDRAQLESLERTGSYGPYEKELIHNDGRIIPVRLQGRIFEHEGERFIWSMVEDISARRGVEDQRREHLRFLGAMERVNRAIRFAPDLDQLLGAVLQELVSIFGCDRAFLIYPCDPTAPSFRIMREATRSKWPGALEVGTGDIPMNPEAVAMFTLAIESEDPIRCDPESGIAIERTAREFGVQSQMFLALHPKSGLAWVLGMHHCETPHVWTLEEARVFRETGRRMSDAVSGALVLRDLRESEERLRTLVEHAPEAILVFDAETNRFVQANTKATVLFKRTARELCELGPLDVCDTIQPDGRRKEAVISEAVSGALGGELVVMEWSCCDADGKQIQCEVRLVRFPAGSRSLVRISLTDMTERRLLEEQLRQAVKMQAVGTLAGGVAHDFNNLLTVILGGSDELARFLGPAHPLANEIREVVQAAQRAAELTRQLLAFSRKQAMIPRVIDLNEVVSEVVRFVARLIGEDVTLEVRLADRPVITRADRGQIGQVIVNLCTNARDAMPSGGTLRIETGSCELGPDEPARPSDVAAGSYATVEVADTGTGIPKAILNRLFEPFFTTKQVGKGTGLGLSTAYGIVKQSGGGIMVRSEPGRGASFKVFLPAVADQQPESESRRQVPLASQQGTETILVVEDNAAVAALVSTVLRERGYVVLQASDGDQALELLRSRGIDDVDLLLTDRVMPVMSGPMLALRLRERSPNLKVLCMSGYDDAGVEGEQLELLKKPFTPAELLARVRGALDRSAQERGLGQGVDSAPPTGQNTEP